MEEGIVLENDYTDVYGNYIHIQVSEDMVVGYHHLNKKSPWEVGKRVAKGEIIGNLGMTGKATGPHVHLIFKNGKLVYKNEESDDPHAHIAMWEDHKRVNPADYLDFN